MSACSTPGCSGDRYGIAEKCVRCLWPEPQHLQSTGPGEVAPAARMAQNASPGRSDGAAAGAAAAGPSQDRVIRVTTVRTAAPVPQVLSVHTQVDHAAADARDAGSTPRPAPPCCARVGAWWCLREAGHEPPCWTPHTREVTTPAIERGTRSPR